MTAASEPSGTVVVGASAKQPAPSKAWQELAVGDVEALRDWLDVEAASMAPGAKPKAKKAAPAAKKKKRKQKTRGGIDGAGRKAQGKEDSPAELSRAWEQALAEVCRVGQEEINAANAKSLTALAKLLDSHAPRHRKREKKWCVCGNGDGTMDVCAMGADGRCNGWTHLACWGIEPRSEPWQQWVCPLCRLAEFV